LPRAERITISRGETTRTGYGGYVDEGFRNFSP
jgi:hypothetical protein